MISTYTTETGQQLTMCVTRASDIKVAVALGMKLITAKVPIGSTFDEFVEEMADLLGSSERIVRNMIVAYA